MKSKKKDITIEKFQRKNSFNVSFFIEIFYYLWNKKNRIIFCAFLLMLFLLCRQIYNSHQKIKKIDTALVGVNSAQAAGIDISKYSESPYFLPKPDGDPDNFYYDDTVIANMNTLCAYVTEQQDYLISKHSDAKYVDPFLSVIWSVAIEEIGADNYFWNCYGNKDINTECDPSHYTPGGWQVGYGIQVSQAASHVAEDFDTVYGGSKGASYVKEVGQKVIDDSEGKITNPLTFPNKDLVTLVNEANSGNSSSQRALAILLMDKKLGAVVVSREIAGDIARENNWAATMRRWDETYYGAKMQTFSNRMKKIAEDYTCKATDSSGTGEKKTITLSIKLKPQSKDSYVMNIATAVALDDKSESTDGTTGSNPDDSSGPVNPDATCPGKGPISCGTLASPVNDCGHCSPGYQQIVCGGTCDFCQAPYDGAKFAIDISNGVGDPVYIPKLSIGGKATNVTCIGYGDQQGSVYPDQIIQIVSCSKDDNPDQAVWMQFHHSDQNVPTIVGKEYKSGQSVGKTANFSGSHVHFQLGISGACGFDGVGGCVNPMNYVQCGKKT